MIIAVLGLPGSGKSFFASRLAKRLRAKYVSSDNIRLKVLEQRTYAIAEKLKVYDLMIQEMKQALEQGEKLILDATFYKNQIRQKFSEAATFYEQKIIFIEIRANESLIQERVSRKRRESEADYPVYLKLKKEFEPLSHDHLILESKRDNIAEMIDAAILYLSQQ